MDRLTKRFIFIFPTGGEDMPETQRVRKDTQMKRIVSLLLAACMLLALTACGNSDDAAQTASPEETTSTTTSTGTREEGKLIVAMECAYAPYNWTQGDDSNGAVQIKDSTDYAYGYDVMMAKYICEKLGWELEIVKSDWESIIPAIQSGTVDAGICGQSITSDRLELVDFTTPYYYADIVTLVSSDSEYANATCVDDLAGGTCTSQLNTVWYDTCLPQIPNANILAAQDTAPAMIVALTSGAVDYIVTDQPTALAAVAANPSLKMLDFGGGDGDFQVSEEEINIGISIQKGNTALVDAINGVLAELTAEDFTDWMNQAIAVQPLSED